LSDPPALECSFWSPTENEEPYNAVTYGCMGFSHSRPPADVAVTLAFNQRCTATLSPSVKYECYQITKMANFTYFISQAEALKDPKSCVDNSQPSYIYQTSFRSFTHAKEAFNGTVIMVTGAETSTVLDPETAVNYTMYSSLLTTVDERTESLAPSLAPTPSSAVSRSWQTIFLSITTSFIMVIW